MIYYTVFILFSLKLKLSIHTQFNHLSRFLDIHIMKRGEFYCKFPISLMLIDIHMCTSRYRI